MSVVQSIPFTMNYFALKTFGKQQYSNVWAALSELVANGFDAGANNVYLFIDMSDKRRAIVEIIDDGSGMDEDDLRKKYAVIGRNRRLDYANDNAAGRKGIGKLAALYLSDKDQIISHKAGHSTAWGVDVQGKGDNEIPSLEPIDFANIEISCVDTWNSINDNGGTMIRLVDVDLTRIGERAIESLKRRLSNHFILGAANRHLYLAIAKKAGDKVDFEEVQKEIAFDNMAFILTSDSQLIDAHSETFQDEYTTKDGRVKTLSFKKTVLAFPDEVMAVDGDQKLALSGDAVFEGKSKHYCLTGWLGIHVSIDNEHAKKNDARFVRNSFYNPNQIRIYVRNKLANETFLSRLNLTGTFTNYIEGEVSFDILDDNDLEDIATTNRQDFSFDDDERIILLRNILRSLCRQLIGHRQKLADQIKKAKKEDDDKAQSKKKTSFAHQTHRDLLSAGITPDKADELSFVISNKLSGDYDLKSEYKLFISHSSRDRIFTDFVAHYLRYRGFRWDKDADKTDIFYSSDGTDITSGIPLADIIKRMLLDANTDILFFTSDNFRNSQYCMFEGGAAWATRSVVGYSIISLDYNSIPEYLTNGKPEFTFSTKDRSSFVLNKQSYSNLVIILNRLISHLNNNRIKIGEDPIELIPEPQFDDLVQMRIKGKEIKDYMDSDVYLYWQTYVIENLDKYFADKDTEESENGVDSGTGDRAACVLV